MTSARTNLAALRDKPQEGSAPPRTIGQMLASDAVKHQIALALPKHMTADRLARIALTEVRKTPKLAQANPTSLLGAVIQCAQLGLEPGGALGHAYLLPFDKRRKNAQGRWETVDTEVQLIIGYRGMIDLARRSGQIVSLEARAVHAADHFVVRYGLDATLEHVPNFEADDRGELVYVYAVAKLKDGGAQFEVMHRREVDAIRARSKSKDDGPWVTDYEAMAKKTVLRRLFKLLPVSIELQRAVGLDEQAEVGVLQNNAALIDADYTRIEHADDEHAAALTADADAEEGSPVRPEPAPAAANPSDKPTWE